MFIPHLYNMILNSSVMRNVTFLKVFMKHKKECVKFGTFNNMNALKLNRTLADESDSSKSPNLVITDNKIH